MEDSVSLAERLEKIKSPKLQNQRETAVVLSAIEDTLRDQNHESTPTAYFAALLALLSQAISNSNGIVNKELATSVVYLLDLVSSHVPAPLLRSKFTQILTSLAPALTHQEAEAPLLRSSMGCLESLLVAQDTSAWALPSSQVGPRRAVAGLLGLALDHRPKVRKRALDAITKVLQNPPPSPSLDHPAADMCAETALHRLKDTAQSSNKKQHKGRGTNEEHQPVLMHALQLVKTVASAESGWPSKRIDALCEVLLNIARTSSNYLTMAVFEIFDTVFEGMADEISSAKLPRLMEAITELRPSQNDAQLLPPWIAVLSRGYDVSAQMDPEETFFKLPDLFIMVSEFISSTSHNIRISAAECLVSFLVNCVPSNVILDPSVYDRKILEKISKAATDLLSVKYQAAWMEVLNVLSAIFDTLKWQSAPVLNAVVQTVGALRASDSFNGKKEVDAVLGKAIQAMGPEAVLDILPLNLAKPVAGQPGRAWLLPLLRDNIINTKIAHFKTELVPLSEAMFQRVVDHDNVEKTMEIKIYETIVSQIWACLPGYFSLPMDLIESFDQAFAELLSNLLYKQTELRVDICRALQALVEQNKEILGLEGADDLIMQRRITKASAQKNIEHISKFAGNMLAVLFNVYSETLPHHRGYILQCINAYLSVTPEAEIMETFTRVASMLEDALQEPVSQTQAEKQKAKNQGNKMPPTSHTLMDLVITMSVYLPRTSFASLFHMASLILPQKNDTQLQKKAYKLLPRLATSEKGVDALKDRNDHLQSVLLSSAPFVSSPARRDRLAAIATVIEYMPSQSLHFIPSILSEVVISAKEVNEKARTSAFDVLVLMGNKMLAGGKIDQSKISHMDSSASITDASIEEFFTMVSAGLAGSTPHMISASITALTRILYEFRTKLSDEVLEELVSTIDLFLTSNNREVVRSCLGFVKVAIISLPEKIISPRLETLITGLMGWSHEHKARFRSKVKHIFERLIRRFGYETIERYCPEQDKKLLANIRKTKERKKRKKEAAAGEGEGEQTLDKRRGKFESEFDEAVYGSGSEDSNSDPEDSENDVGGRRRKNARQGDETYIIEDEDEPLDLLDRKALGHISSTKPLKSKFGVADGKRKPKAKVNIDGKLVFNDKDDKDAEMGDVDEELGDGTLEGGINAYVDAIKGRDAVQRGRGGRLKFSNKRDKGEMDLDDEEDGIVAKQKKPERRGLEGRTNRSGSGRGAMGSGTRGGRIVKSRGKFGRGKR